MYHCEACGRTFEHFETPGKCPRCGVWANVTCGGCGYTGSAEEFIAAMDRCPRCGAAVAIGGAFPEVPPIPTGPEAVEGCIDVLTGRLGMGTVEGVRVTRGDAARALGWLDDDGNLAVGPDAQLSPRAVDPLIAALKRRRWLGAMSRNAETSSIAGLRCRAAEALGKHRDRRAVEALIAALQDRWVGWRVQVAAARALGTSGDPRAVEPLIAALRQGGLGSRRSVQAAAARALGELGDPRAVEPLVAALEDAGLRRDASQVLEAIGGAEAEQALAAHRAD